MPLISQAATLVRTPARIAAPLEDKGASTDEMLASIGYDAAQVATFKQTGVV